MKTSLIYKKNVLAIYIYLLFNKIADFRDVAAQKLPISIYIAAVSNSSNWQKKQFCTLKILEETTRSFDKQVKENNTLVYKKIFLFIHGRNYILNAALMIPKHKCGTFGLTAEVASTYFRKKVKKNCIYITRVESLNCKLCSCML